MKILHVTDSEGTRAFLDAVSHSSVVRHDPQGGLQFCEEGGEHHFIYGGDVTDRGNRDLFVTRLLVDFKRRHPSEVTLLVGNRDINKTRLVELAPQRIRERLLKGESPRWLGPGRRTVPLDYVEARREAQGVGLGVEAYVGSLSIEQCQAIYLRWMLDQTMGCPETFRYRREELARERGGAEVAEEDVVRSFIAQASPEGLTGQYLRLGQIGVVVPGTGVMAVHGGISAANAGRIPGREGVVRSARAWLEGYDQWYRAQLERWIATGGDVPLQPAWDELNEHAIAMPGRPRSVIVADMLTAEGRFVEVPAEVAEYLREGGVSVVLTGHRPTGDTAAIVRSGDGRVVFVNDDTGYAAGDGASIDDSRGAARHTTELTVEAGRVHVHVRGVLRDGTPVETRLTMGPEGIEGPERWIGRVLEGHWLVQCRLPSGEYRLMHKEGHRDAYRVVSEAELA